MARVTVRVVDGGVRQLDVRTIGDVKSELGLSTYDAHVRGEVWSDDTEIADGDVVVLAGRLQPVAASFEEVVRWAHKSSHGEDEIESVFLLLATKLLTADDFAPLLRIVSSITDRQALGDLIAAAEAQHVKLDEIDDRQPSPAWTGAEDSSICHCEKCEVETAVEPSKKVTDSDESPDKID